MHCSRNARTSKRSVSIDQPPNRVSIGHQSRSPVVHFSPNPARNIFFCAPVNHEISQYRPAIEAPSHGEVATCSTSLCDNFEDQFCAMSRSKLELVMNLKTAELEIYKNNFEKYEKLCGVLQRRLDAVKNLETEHNILKSKWDEMQHANAQKDREYADLRRNCDRFISDYQRGSVDGCSEAKGDYTTVMETPIRY